MNDKEFKKGKLAKEGEREEEERKCKKNTPGGGEWQRKEGSNKARDDCFYVQHFWWVQVVL